MIDDEYAAFVAAFRAEHRELHKSVQTLGRVLDKSRSWSQKASNEAAEALAAMEKHLRRHFAQEEKGGYLEESLAVAPRFSHEAAQLLDQHSVLLRTANQALESARRSSDAQTWEKLKSEVASLIAAVLAHENAEDQIVQQALNSGEEPA